MDDLISVIVPFYNVEKYILACLESVIHQSYKNLEIILVNDKSPDNSIEIIRRISEFDSRIIIIEHGKNLGLGAARNTGLRIAQGKYVMYLDSDDRYTLDAVECLHEEAVRSDADMVVGRMVWVKDSKLDPVGYIDEKISYYERFNAENLVDVCDRGIYLGQVCNRIYRREWIQEHQLRFPEQVYWEDMPFSVDCWFSARKISYISDCVYLRTERNEEGNLSITQDYSMKKYTDRNIIEQLIYEILYKHYRSNRMNKQSALIILNRIYSASKNMLGKQNEELNFWIDEWFEKNTDLHNELMNKISNWRDTRWID